MLYYKLVEVLHTGTKGTPGESRRFEPAYARRIDKVFKIYNTPVVGERAELYYAGHNDEHYVITSTVKSVNKHDDWLRITTENSVFILKEMEKQLIDTTWYM